jgi:hypothetical protein
VIYALEKLSTNDFAFYQLAEISLSRPANISCSEGLPQRPGNNSHQMIGGRSVIKHICKTELTGLRLRFVLRLKSRTAGQKLFEFSSTRTKANLVEMLKYNDL